MAGPKRLPKSKEERDFDKLMRDRRPSVWEDKGSVGDEHFRSLKGAAKLQQGVSSGSLLPPLAGAGKSEPDAADRTHGASADAAVPDAMVAAQRARRHGCVPAPARGVQRSVRGRGVHAWECRRCRLARSQPQPPPPKQVVTRGGWNVGAGAEV